MTNLFESSCDNNDILSVQNIRTFPIMIQNVLMTVKEPPNEKPCFFGIIEQ